MSSLPPFIAPPDWRSRLRGFLGGTGRQRKPLVVLGVVALVVGFLAVRELVPRPEPAPADGGPITVADVEAAATPAPGSGAGAGDAGALFVHVTGRVNGPGLQDLPAGSRVADAVEAAGGVTEGADLERVNLARKLTDGEQVHVPAEGEPVVTEPPQVSGDPPEPGAGQPIDLNTATTEQLQSLPGIGEVTATRIVEHRDQQPFRSVEELLDVSGIGPSKLESLRDLVAVN